MKTRSLVASVAILGASCGAQSEVRIATVDGRSFEGKHLGYDARTQTFTMSRPGDETLPVPFADIESVAFRRSEADPIVATPRILFRSGASVVVHSFLPTPETDSLASFRFRLAENAEAVSVPLSYIEAIVFRELQSDGGQSVRAAIDKPDDTKDYVFVQADSSLRRQRVHVGGVLESDSNAVLALRFGDRDYRVPLERVGAVVFAVARGAAPAPLPNPLVHIKCHAEDISLSGHLVSLQNRKLAVRLAEGFLVDLPIQTVKRLSVATDALVWLSDLVPRSETYTRALDSKRSWLRDRSPCGPGLRLGGRTHNKGLLLPPRTRLTFDVPRDGRRRFRATVGIDARAGSLGHAVIRILADDKLLIERTVTAKGLPFDLDLALGEALTLSLETDFGKRFDLGDHCAFGSARLTPDKGP